ncbi:hypothetical protein [Aristophania vespae]|uniref:hypothetical protein n=1 Tax=Aristophania vespae TaxID=2697033 RepID=UPI0023515B71|nr:hypothetical protein [Aristophania vespae]UMM64038.1 hypothetical protein DM15PD_10190 [Aristophania vespae]
MNDKEFYENYQNTYGYMYETECSLPFLFPHGLNIQDITRKWSQNALDSTFRSLTCLLVEHQYMPPKDNLLILKELANFDPSNLDGYAIWETHQFHLTEKGVALVKDCNLNLDSEEVSPLFKAKLTAMFEEHGVGFEKKAFVPIQY